MKRSEMIRLIAEQLFYRDLANEHQFWYTEEDRPLLAEQSDFAKEAFYADAKSLLSKLEQAGLKPPLTKRCPVLLTTIHTWDKEEQNETK
jgi:hypothetical protein